MRDGKEPFYQHHHPKPNQLKMKGTKPDRPSEAKGSSDTMYPVTEHISFKCAPSPSSGPTLTLHVSGFNQLYGEMLTFIYCHSSVPYTPELSVTQQQHLTRGWLRGCSTLWACLLLALGLAWHNSLHSCFWMKHSTLGGTFEPCTGPWVTELINSIPKLYFVFGLDSSTFTGGHYALLRSSWKTLSSLTQLHSRGCTESVDEWTTCQVKSNSRRVEATSGLQFSLFQWNYQPVRFAGPWTLRTRFCNYTGFLLFTVFFYLYSFIFILRPFLCSKEPLLDYSCICARSIKETTQF